LDLRVNTIWAFKKKVLERIHDLEKKGRRPTASVWEEVVIVPKKATRKEKTTRAAVATDSRVP
jgi:hypothetical protein